VPLIMVGVRASTMEALRRGARMIILAVALDSPSILEIGLASTPLHAPCTSSLFSACKQSAGLIAALNSFYSHHLAPQLAPSAVVIDASIDFLW
jgi:hypothetical protein